MENTLPANNLVALKFTENFSESKYELFEVDNELAEAIMKGQTEMVIKSYEPLVKRDAAADLLGQSQNKQITRTAALCSETATFRLKKSETSNTMLVTSLSKGDIYKETSIYIELDKCPTNRYQIARLI